MANEPNGHKSRASTTALSAEVPGDALVDTRGLERVFDEFPWRDRRVFLRARKRARARVLEAVDTVGEGAEDTRAALLIAAGELVAGTRRELADAPDLASRLLEDVEGATGLSRLSLAREVLRAPESLAAAPIGAAEAQLGLLLVVAPLRSASLWMLDDTEQVNCICHVGEGHASRGTRDLARRVIAGEDTDSSGSRRLLVGLPVGPSRQPLGALIGSARPGLREECASLLAEAAPILAAILERDSLLSANAASERALVQSSERKLTRLGYDLHDGPMQRVVVLGDDLRLFREQLVQLLGRSSDRGLVCGRLDDLEAHLTALDKELRQIANEVHSASVLLDRPFGVALREVARSFAVRTGIDPQLTVEGDLRTLSVSQQIALLNIVHEALANIREHSGASTVEIGLSVTDEGVDAMVSDNGCGFDPEKTLIRAARKGRLGLVAMHERTRLLGGQYRIDSRPGGPTVISVALERWEPLASGDAPPRLSA